MARHAALADKKYLARYKKKYIFAREYWIFLADPLVYESIDNVDAAFYGQKCCTYWIHGKKYSADFAREMQFANIST